MKVKVPANVLSRKDEITSSFCKLVQQHVDDLLQHCVERRFHATDFGKMLFIHPRHLTNTIKLTTGKSPSDIMEEKIAQAACHLLKTTTLPVATIADAFAYNDPTNFTKFFKSMMDMTPLQYRKSHQ